MTVPNLFQRGLRAAGARVNVPLYHALFPRRRLPIQPTHRVGLFKADGLGDFVLALGAIRALLDRFGTENCILITSPAARDFARHEFPELDQVIVTPFSGRLWRTWAHLRHLRSTPLFQHGVNDLISLRHHRYLHQDLLIASIPSQRTFGLQKSPCSFAGEASQGRLRFDQEALCPAIVRAGWCLDLECHQTLLDLVSGTSSDPKQTVPRLSSRELVEREPWVAVAPYGAHPIRDLPISLIAELSRHLATRHRLGLRLLSSPSQAPRLTRDVETLRWAGVPDVQLMVTPDLAGLVMAIDRTRLLVATETATAHLGAAADAPMVGIIGGGHYGRFAPWIRSNRQRWVEWKLPCFGCNWSCIHSSPLCITDLPPRLVLTTIDELLDTTF